MSCGHRSETAIEGFGLLLDAAMMPVIVAIAECERHAKVSGELVIWVVWAYSDCFCVVGVYDAAEQCRGSGCGPLRAQPIPERDEHGTMSSSKALT